MSATDKQLSIAAGVLPQSSCSFKPIAPALMISTNPSGFALLPCMIHHESKDMATLCLLKEFQFEVSFLLKDISPFCSFSSILINIMHEHKVHHTNK